MVALLPSPVLQFADADGAPYAGGTLATYTPNSTTPVTTWSDAAGTVANAQPIVLDAAGRCSLYASGAVRLVLSDINGVEVFDAPSNTLVSTAMAPVCLSTDLATARSTLGVTAAIATETSRALAAEGVLTTTVATLATADALSAEVARAEAAEAAGTAALVAAEAAIAKVQAGATNSGSGSVVVTFPVPFSTNAIACTASATGFSSGSECVTVGNLTLTNVTIWTTTPAGAAAPGIGLFWIAVGL